MNLNWTRSASRAAIALATLTLPAAALAQSAAPTAPADEAVAIGDIVVTAERRATSLQRTPQAIAVLQGEAQFQRGQTGLLDIKTSVPNVNFASTSNTSPSLIRPRSTNAWIDVA